MADVTLAELQKFREGVPVGIFAGLDDAALQKVAAIANRKRFSAGELIIEDGAEGDTMYLLLKGKVKVSKKLMVKSAKRVGEGEKEIISLPAEWNPYFGELALFDPKSLRTASVAAVDDSECGVLANKDFLALANSDHSLGYMVLKNVLQKQAGTIRKQNENILNLTTALSFALSSQ